MTSKNCINSLFIALISSLMAGSLNFAGAQEIFTNRACAHTDFVADSQIFACQLESPGGELNFYLEVAGDGVQTTGFLVNGRERIGIPSVQIDDSKMIIEIDHYDSRIDARWSTDHFVGTWTKVASKGKRTVMQFKASPAEALPSFAGKLDADHPVSGRWRVRFSESDDDAIGIFQGFANGHVLGTFMTTTGDYRFLAGKFQDNQLRLSCFDGAHAFLFVANLKTEAETPKQLEGDFWSRDSWHETWSAVRDDDAKLPDSFQLTKWSGNVTLDQMKFPDLDGNLRTLGDDELLGPVTLIHVFGSWCPNCHDAGNYLQKLKSKYARRGLKIVGVAFELGDSFDRNVGQVKKYLARHDMQYPVLIAGDADKSEASAKFTVIDRVRSYPTTIFVNHRREITAIHTGFSGPATGEAYEQLQQEFESRIEQLLDDAGK